VTKRRDAGTRRITPLFLAGIIGATLCATPVARGDAHEIPKLIAVAGDSEGAARLWSGEWTRSEGEGTCHGMAILGTPGFPQRSVKFAAPGSIRLEFQSPEVPDSVSIKTWRTVRKKGGLRLADGPSRKPEFRIEQVTAADGSAAAWAAVFDARRVRHFYVGVRATWPDEETCGGPRNARWVVRLQGV
jgi:hypothetical protein